VKIASHLFDSRIDASNVLVEMSISEYEGLVKNVLKNNVFQRKRVRSSKTVYALLKHDLMRECVIPPVVLALTSGAKGYDEHDEHAEDELISKIRENSDHLVILDGLQRTHTILDLLEELRSSKDEAGIKKLENARLRVEIYIGLNRLGILYRMLTLNTGQTPMSLRQQIEILYLDYLGATIEGVELVREADGKAANKANQYNFKDVIEGFNAYLDRDELPIDKADILENINSLEKLSKENQSSELFEKYLRAFHLFTTAAVDLCGQSELGDEYLEKNSAPFGKSAIQIFKKPQSMSGFGAAVGKLIDFEVVKDIDEVISVISKLEVSDVDEFLEEINNSLNWLKNNTSKIGNAQRTFFSFYFRDILNKDADSYRDLTEAAKSALRKYQSQNM
jgi:dsDNA-binding SOS-regulon protein